MAYNEPEQGKHWKVPGNDKMLDWTGKKSFRLGNAEFTLDLTAGYDRRPSEDGNFTLVKNRSYLRDYMRLRRNRYDHILELGVFQGGSMVFFDNLFKPGKIVGVELAEQPVPALDNYIRDEAPHMKVFYGSSQDDEALLMRIFKQEFDSQLDLVVDDASHLYEQTRTSLKFLFPLLSPGGTYLIEDWAWSHRENAQVDGHPWSELPSMTNVVFELVAELATSEEIEDIYINNNVVRITKAKDASSTALLENLALRGKEMQLI